MIDQTLMPGVAINNTISYQLTWDITGATKTGESLLITNDLGYTIRLESAYLANATIELIPCTEESLTTFSRLLYTPTAHAGHGEDASDPSRIIFTYVEAIASTPIARFSSEEWPSETTTQYCEAYYLVAPTLDEDVSQATVNMAQKSLYLEGYYSTADNLTETHFVLQTHLPWGTFGNIQVSDTSATSLAIERQISTMFNGVDFLVQPAEDQITTILRNILEDTVFIWQ